jgi:hypothetical protein
VTDASFWNIYYHKQFHKSRKEKVGNGTIRVIMEVGKNILEVTEEKWLRWFGQTAMENFRMGTRGNAKKGKTQRETDR